MWEEAIINKIRAGNPAGLEGLMDRYLPYVSAVVWHILRGAMPAEDGEEIVSDVFLAAWNRPEALRAGSVKAWLGAVARNKPYPPSGGGRPGHSRPRRPARRI